MNNELQIDKKRTLGPFKKIPKVAFTLLSGSLAALAFSIEALWFLGFVALVPLIFVLRNTKNLKQSVFHGFTFGSLYFGVVLSFIFSAHPLDWLGVENKTVSLIGITASWLLAVFVLSTGPVLWSLLFHKTRNFRFVIFFAPSLWVLTEFFQATFFSLFFYGDGGLIGPHWTFGFLGYTLAESSFLLSLASIGGVFMLSFVNVLINFITFDFITDGNFRYLQAASVIAVVILSGIFYLHSPTADDKKTIAVLHTNFAPAFLQGSHEQERQFDKLDKLLRQLSKEKEHSDIIILPENSFYFMQLVTDFGVQYRLDSLSERGEVLILDSVRTDEPGPDLSKLVFVNSREIKEGYGVSAHTKHLLVPQGEYLSNVILWLGKNYLDTNWLEGFNDKRALKRGEGVTLGRSGEVKIGALFCSETITPTLYREATRNGAGVLANSASHSVFTNSKILEKQILKYSKVRARENNRYLVQAGNKTLSFALNEKGEVIKVLDNETDSFFQIEINSFSHLTPFVILGTRGVFTIFLILSAILLLLDSDVLRMKKSHQATAG